MKKLLTWWYALSLPRHVPATNPIEREKERRANLTAGLLLLIGCLLLPVLPVMLFFSPASPSSPPIGFSLLCLLLLSWITGRVGRQIISGTCVILVILVGATAPLFTNPFSAPFTSLFGEFTIAVILAGALLPPVAALITGAIACLIIALVNFLSLNMNTYNQGSQLHFMPINILSLSLLVPVTIQIIVAVIVYVIMSNLLAAIRRADRAEEIVALQSAIADHEHARLNEQKQLEEGLRKIAEAHSRIANGDYQTRISLNDGNVLWSIAIPLNNLLNRLQHWKNDADTLLVTRQAAEYTARQLQYLSMKEQARSLSLTGTLLDPVIVEVNNVLASQAYSPTKPQN